MNKSISSPRPLGLIGGMSWESTLTYYQVINRETQDRLGGVSSARIFMDSLDFAPIEARQSQDDWEGLGRIMATSARTLERAGAGLILIGLIVLAGFTLVSVKLVFLILVFGLMTPTATHAVARAALHAGVKPIVTDEPPGEADPEPGEGAS